MSAYGLTKTARPTSPPAMSRRSIWTAEQRRDEQRAEQEVGLPQQQFVRVELRHQDDGEQQEDPLRQAPLGQSRDRPAQQCREKPDLDGEPEHLPGVLIDHPERGHHHREHRKVLELVVAVFRTVQRFGVEGSHDRLSPRDEVDHLVTNPRVVDDDGQHNERKKGERPESRRHVRNMSLRAAASAHASARHRKRMRQAAISTAPTLTAANSMR